MITEQKFQDVHQDVPYEYKPTWVSGDIKVKKNK